MLRHSVLQPKLVNMYHLFFQESYTVGRKNLSSLKFANFLSRTKLLGVSALHTSSKIFCKKHEMEVSSKDLATREHFFREIKSKNKETFLQVLKTYEEPGKLRRGHVEFIYAALNCMEMYGANFDLEAYKKLMNVFPKGKMIPKNLIQAEFFHFPRQQDCATVLLDQMEYYGVCPDREMVQIVKNAFGKSSHVYKKLMRMMYWMPKLKNINPYMMPDPMPSDPRELARLALKKMSVDIRTKISEYDAKEIEESNDKTWIMSAQSPVQQKLIQEHPVEKALFIEGPSLVWLKRLSMSYFVLRADPKVYPEIEVDYDDVTNLKLFMFGEPKELVLAPSSVHEQEDGIIMAMCCTGTSSKDSLLSWVRFLQQSNPKLDNIPVLFKIRSSPTTLVSVNAEKSEEEAETVKDNIGS